MEAVLRMTNLFEEFILRIISLQFKRFSLAVGKSSIVWEGYWMQNNAKSTLLKSLQLIALCSGHAVMYAAVRSFDCKVVINLSSCSVQVQTRKHTKCFF